MAKQRLFRLNRGYAGFYCPDTRLNLIAGIRPQGVYPSDIPLSQAVITGLKGGTIMDVNGVITEDDLAGKAPTNIAEQMEANGIELDQPRALSEVEIDGITSKKEMQMAIKEARIDPRKLEVDGSASLEELKAAVKAYYGYDAKPKNFSEEGKKK